jgi:hypothetical protein
MPHWLNRSLHGFLALTILVLSALSGLRVVVERTDSVGDHQVMCALDGWRGAGPAHDLMPVALVGGLISQAPIGSVGTAFNREPVAASQCDIAAPTDRLGSARGPRAP